MEHRKPVKLYIREDYTCYGIHFYILFVSGVFTSEWETPSPHAILRYPEATPYPATPGQPARNHRPLKVSKLFSSNFFNRNS